MTSAARPIPKAWWSARSRASPRSTSTTPRSSSAGSVSSRRWSPGSWARRSWASSARRVAASPRRCARGCCRRSRTGCCPGSEGWALALLRPGEHPQRALADAIAAAGPVGRLIVAVDQFEEVFTACRDETERTAFADALVASRARPAAAHDRPGRDPRGLLRALRELSRAVAAAGRQPGHGRADAARRAAPCDRAARDPGRPAGRAGAGRRADRRRRGRARGAAVDVDRVARAVAAARRPATAHLRLRAGGRRRRRGRAARGAHIRAAGSRAARDRAANPLALGRAKARATRSCAAAWPSTSCRATESPRSSTSSPTTGW